MALPLNVTFQIVSDLRLCLHEEVEEMEDLQVVSGQKQSSSLCDELTHKLPLDDALLQNLVVWLQFYVACNAHQEPVL